MSEEQARRAKRREPTKDRMLEAAAELLRSEGPSALTTVRVTREAGIVQSGFYAHFKSPEHLETALAERAARELEALFHGWVVHLNEAGTDRGPLAEAFARILAVPLETRASIDLFIRYRRAASPLGALLGPVHTRLRAEMFQLLRDRLAGLSLEADLGTLGMHADLLVAALFGVFEGVLDGGVRDLPAAARALAAIMLDPVRPAPDR